MVVEYESSLAKTGVRIFPLVGHSELRYEFDPEYNRSHPDETCEKPRRGDTRIIGRHAAFKFGACFLCDFPRIDLAHIPFSANKLRVIGSQDNYGRPELKTPSELSPDDQARF